MYMYGGMNMRVMGTHGNQKKVQNLLELELQAVVDSPVWVIDIELSSSGRSACFLKCWIISLAPCLDIFNEIIHLLG